MNISFLITGSEQVTTMNVELKFNYPFNAKKKSI